MASSVGRICGSGAPLLKSGSIGMKQMSTFSSKIEWTKGRKALVASLGVLAGGAGALVFALDQSVKASDLALQPGYLTWSHKGSFTGAALDHASIRRGYEVYKQVCSACHSLKFMAYRQLVGVSHTEAEAKDEASQIMVQDGPDDDGNMFERPGKLSDSFPSPYQNEQAARAANNGAFPPDLSKIIRARASGSLIYHGDDYVFHLLTGYCDPPAGITLDEGQHYNPYFPGGAIGMAQLLYNETIDYSDGTPATASQLAKDVTTFLVWTSWPHHDEWRLFNLRFFTLSAVAVGLITVMYRRKWSVMMTRKIFFRPKKE